LFKAQLAYLKCLNDIILNLNIDDLLSEKQKLDIERNLTNRIVIGAFGLILLLLLILNTSNMFIDNSISEISEQKEDKKTIELQVNQLDKKINQLKADIHSLSNLKDGNQRISKILRIISDSHIEQMSLTDLRLIKTESNIIDIKLNGESDSKDEVINFIKNLESNKNLHSIELVGMNKNNEILNDGLSPKYDYKFSISMKFDDNKKS
jgi:Tfp pilus assembly protein PilN